MKTRLHQLSVVSVLIAAVVSLGFTMSAQASYRSVCYVTMLNDMNTPMHFFYFDHYYYLPKGRSHDFEVGCSGFDNAKTELMKKYKPGKSYYLLSDNQLVLRASGLKTIDIRGLNLVQKDIGARCSSKSVNELYLPGLKLPSIHLYVCKPNQ